MKKLELKNKPIKIIILIILTSISIIFLIAITIFIGAISKIGDGNSINEIFIRNLTAKYYIVKLFLIILTLGFIFMFIFNLLKYKNNPKSNKMHK